MRPQFIHIPNFLANWPFLPTQNSHPEATSTTEASNDWIAGFFISEKKRQQFEAIRADILASMAYPKLNPEHLRTACDAMAVLFLTDDLTDLQSAEEVGEIKRVVMDSFRCVMRVLVYVCHLALILST